MPSEKENLDELVRRFDQLKTIRSPWENQWQDIRTLVRPHAEDFNREGQRSQRGQRKSQDIYDGTAPWSLEQLAAGLFGFMTSPAERWFTLAIKGIPVEELSRPIIDWLELASDILYNEFANPNVKFHSAAHELYLDVGAFGTGVLLQEYIPERQQLLFTTEPLSSCWLAENRYGDIDTCFRSSRKTKRQLEQEYPESVLPKEVLEHKDEDHEWEVIHAVFPRTDTITSEFNITMPFASIHFLKQPNEILRVSGFRTFPYHIPRWSKIAGEIYGRSPAMVCLPDIKSINQVMKTYIKSAQKLVDPPLMIPEDGFMMPIKTAPSSLNYYTPGTDPMVPLTTGAQLEAGADVMARLSDKIAKGFFVDWLLQQKNNLEMTATEVIDRRDEKLALLSPVFGRLQNEMHGPMIRRAFDLMVQHGRIPFPPVEMLSLPLDLVYNSAVSRAQNISKAATIQRHLQQDVIPLAQIDPSVLDAIDLDEVVRELALLRGVSPRVIRDTAAIAQIRQVRAQQQQLAQAQQVGLDASSAVKNISESQRNIAQANAA